MVTEYGLIMSDDLVVRTKERQKTQTRRVVKQPAEIKSLVVDWRRGRWHVGESYKLHVPVKHPDEPDWSDHRWWRIYCPFGTPGSLLYLRQTWSISHLSDDLPVDPYVTYRADGLQVPFKKADLPRAKNGELLPSLFHDGWMTPRFMPKAFAMVWLLLKEVRPERIASILESDAEAEGCRLMAGQTIGGTMGFASARYSFKELWDSLNAKRGYGWKENPWVWVLVYELLTTKGRDDAHRLLAGRGVQA